MMVKINLNFLGVGCGAPVNFANIREGEAVVDIDSGGGKSDWY
jgi:hypothetical protein